MKGRTVVQLIPPIHYIILKLNLTEYYKKSLYYMYVHCREV